MTESTTFYGYGYYFSGPPKTANMTKLENSKWYHRINSTKNDTSFFFGINIQKIDTDNGDCYLIPLNPRINYIEFTQMINDYRNIFNISPDLAHNYIINTIY